MNEKRYGRIAPSVAEITARRNTNLGWDRALAEMIDNSLDAGAQNIRIKIEGRVIEVQDDGRGIVDLLAAATSGRHMRSETTELGMYGVGLKDAWYWAGPRMEIESIHKGVLGKLVADFREIQSRGDWEIELPTHEGTREKSGTKIKLFLSDETPRRFPPVESHFQKLAWIFTPALLEGKCIRVPYSESMKRLKPVKLPAFMESVKELFEVGGKQVEIEIGLTEKHEALDRDGPIWIQFGHRYIDSSFIGCGNYAASRVRGVVRLIQSSNPDAPKWKLAKNKDGLTDHKKELAEAIHGKIKHLLDKSDELSRNAELDELARDIQLNLNTLLTNSKRMAREARSHGAGSAVGTVLAKASGKKRKNASSYELDPSGPIEIADGEGEGQSTSNGYCRFHFAELKNPHSVGQFTDDGGVRLNISNPVVKKLCEDKNEHAIYILALSIISHSVVTQDGPQKFLFEKDSFEETLGLSLALSVLGGGK